MNNESTNTNNQIAGTLILNGREYPLSLELTENLKVELGINDPFEKCTGTHYYRIGTDGEVRVAEDDGTRFHDAYYAVGNYCRDEVLLKQRALHETLSRLLWRYSEIHGGDPRWTLSSEETINHYYICKNMHTNHYDVGYSYHGKCDGKVYFSSAAITQEAIDKIVLPFCKEHPDFVW